MILFTSIIKCIKAEYINSSTFSMYIYFKFGSVQCVFIIAAISYILYRIYLIFLINYSELSTIIDLRTSKIQIRLLIGLQTFLFTVLTIPFGLYLGINAARFIFHMVKNVVALELTDLLVESTSAIVCIMVITGCAIFIFGIIVDRLIDRKLMI